MKRALSTFMFVLLLVSTLTFAFNTRSVKASGTIYIRADGSVDPPDAPISTVDKVTYTLTGNITSDADGIVVERSNIIIDGAGYTVEGTGTAETRGIYLSGIANVTIKNTNIKHFYYGILLAYSSSNNSISGNNITANNGCGIGLDSSSNNNSISGNNITNNGYGGIALGHSSSNNSISGNNITANNSDGIGLWSSSNNNSISGNNITANSGMGILLAYSSSNNSISGNNITANNSCGIGLFYSSSSNSISGNNITPKSWYGIWLTGLSNNNSISGNNITANSWYGIGLDHSSSNNIFHNNFISNTSQVYSLNSMNVWDDGYPSGGNYWSDYTGVDLHSGQYQNEAGSDGVGDTPYAIDANNTDHYPLMNPWPSGWKLDFTAPTNHPIVDFAVYNGSLYAAADNKLYTYDGSSWNVLDAPAFVTSLEPYGGKLVVGGQGGLYCFDGTSFNMVFSVPTYIKVLGAYNSTLYAGTMLGNPPILYYCNGSVDNPADWHIDTGFSGILNFSGSFGSIDSFCVYDSISDVGNPVGYWKFDEGSGMVANDSSGNGNDGIIVNATYTDDVPFHYSSNFALEFSGPLGPLVPAYSYVTIPDSLSLRPTSGFTIEAWTKAYRPEGRTIVAKEYGPGPYDSYVLWYEWDGILRFSFESSGYPVEAQIPAINEWHHVAGTWDGAIMRLYIDGIEIANKAFSGSIRYDSNPVLIGADDNDGDDIPDEVWNGLIDDVRMYNYARTPAQIWNDHLGRVVYVTSGGVVYCYDGTDWSIVVSYDDVSAFLAMKAYDGKLYLATRDQSWRKPLYQGGTGFSGRVIEYDGENWTTVLDRDYWVYSLEEYDGKLYAGTANKILMYNGTSWETSFNATEGAYYAISMITYDGKIYAGMGNGYIFADPAPAKANPETIAVPEFSSNMILAVFMALTMLAVALTGKNRSKRFS